MAYLALYRKYRPTTFDGLIGQEHIVKTLINQIEGNRLGHAYLFTGTRGTGKTSCAKIFAKAINCLHPVNGSPCGNCECCKSLSDPSNIDIMEIDAASNNGVNEIRDLREKVQYPPVSCKYKVYIIDEVHMLTGAAFNALLKTLEEPPKHAVFVLATTEVHKIPATILSRCMRFDFRLVPNDKIAELISKIYDEQGKEYEKEAIYAIAKAGEGSIRDALSIADTALSYNTGILKYNDVMEILGSSNRELLMSFVENMLSGKSGSVLEIIDKLADLGKSMGVLTKDITSIFRDLLVAKTCNDANNILQLPLNKFTELNNICKSVSEERLIRCLDIFTDCENSLKYTTHPRVVFETCAVKASRPDSDYNIDALLGRIHDLELKLKSNKISDDEHINTAVNYSAKVTPPREPIENKTIQKKKQLINSVSEEELKGKLLFNLRKNGNEMLWNIMQPFHITANNNVLTVTTNSQADMDLLSKPSMKAEIIHAMDEFEDFELNIVLSKKEKNLEAIDEATDRIKKIFGDDIVIIK